MSKIICDTNIVIELFRENAKTIHQLNEIGDENILLCSITNMELIRGIRNKMDLQILEKKLSSFNVLHFDTQCSFLAMNLISKFHLSHGLEIPDAIIAATAMNYSIPLFTYNTKDFKFISGLKLHK
jgi:predicted nucleic acid-binding protein